MTKTQERDQFISLMTNEFPNRGLELVDLLEQLMALARRHGRLQERACNEQMPEGYDEKCEERIADVCFQIGCNPVFSGDPRGATVKLRLPSGKTTDWGSVGVCVPQ